MRITKMLVFLALLAAAGLAQAMPPALYSGLSWRFVGPYRGGRTDAVAGVAGKANIAYVGTVDGGVFKTTDAGVTWQPLFEHQPVASIGAIAVAPSNPKILYVGTGETTIRSDATYGDGIWRSSDGGESWQHVGLEESRHIGRILVAPDDPERVLVAALGNIWKPSRQRGVFLTSDGGEHWEKTLYIDARTGAIDLARDPADPASIYAVTWNVHRTPWFQYAPVSGPGSAIYHSRDGGETWEKLPMHGLPKHAGRIGIVVADTDAGARLYAVVGGTEQGGVYRSDDGGAHWRLMNGQERLWGRGWYFGRINVDPENADVVYVMNTSMYRSTDGGRHFTAIKGSPNGDDLQRLWIDPDNPDHMIATSDQGASVSLDGARKWTPWFNQPTAQIYHISVDERVPYWIYAKQQDSGALAIPARGISGIITNHDWHPVGGGESGYIFPKKGDPNILYASGFGGRVVRYNQATRLSVDISPVPGGAFFAAPTPHGYYFPWNTALAPSPFDPDTLYAAAQVVFKTTNGGQSWETISPPLTRKVPYADCTGTPTRHTAAQCGYSVVYALAPSAVKRGVVWAGTDDGLVWRTSDGGSQWVNVTPEAMANWSRVDTIAAGRHDAASAYLAVDRHQVGDFKPYIYVTHDGGRHWRLAVDGIPKGDYVRVVRPDPKRAGLLYAGTEQGVFVSFNDGRHWQSLQLNLPTASVHDLRIHAGDLIAATHGRGIWILDDIEPLRAASAKIAKSAVHLYDPRPVYRFRLGLYPAEARPPEVPHSANPPAGALIDYWLGKAPAEPITLTIHDPKGRLVRRYSSAAEPVDMPRADFPAYYKSPPAVLPAREGFNRFVWDLRYTPPIWPEPYWAGPAVLDRTPRGPLAPLVVPGKYKLTLSVNGKRYSAPLVVRPNPNTDSTAAALEANVEFALALKAQINRNARLLASANAAVKAARKRHDKARAKKIESALALFDVAGITRRLFGMLRSVSSSNKAPAPGLIDTAARLRSKSRRARDALAVLLVPGL